MPEANNLPYDPVKYPVLIADGEVDIDTDVWAAERAEGRGRRYLQDGVNAAIEKAHREAGFPEDYSHPTDQVRVTISIRAELWK